MDTNALLLEIAKCYPSKTIEDHSSRQAIYQNKINKINYVLTQALTADKPNFTQLQLALQETSSDSPDCYRILRIIMEKHFKLEAI